MTRHSRSKPIVAFLLVGLGTFTLTAAALIPTYALDRLAKTPLDLEVTTVATGFGDVLDASSLRSGRARVDLHVPLISQRYVTTEEPSDTNRITVQAGQTLTRADRPGDAGLLTAMVDRVTLDRVSSMPLDNPVGSIQTQPSKPADEVSHTGLTYKFPIDTDRKTYPYFDVNARRAGEIAFVDETAIDGVPVYHFHQETAAIDLSTVVNSPTNKVTLPADTLGRAWRNRASHDVAFLRERSRRLGRTEDRHRRKRTRATLPVLRTERRKTRSDSSENHVGVQRRNDAVSDR